MLRVTALMSSTTVINIILNTLKVKAMAIFIGTAGMGVFSLFQSIYNVFLSFGGVVAGGSVVKAVAEARSEKRISHLANLQYLLVRISILLGLLSGLIVYVSSEIIARKIFNDDSFVDPIKWMSFILVFINLSLFWQSWLNGYRQVKEIARVRLFSSMTITFFTIGILYFLREDGIIYAILILPLPAFLFARFYATPVNKTLKTISKDNIKALFEIFRLGIVLVVISLIFQFGVIVARSIIASKAGLESVGIVFASWAISMSYVQIFLSALSVEYYPELVSYKDDLKATHQLINKQIHFLLIIIFPVLIIMFILSPYIIPILYNQEFSQAASILKYQLIGDVFKVISWIFGYVLIVHGYLMISLLLQLLWVSSYLLSIWLGIENFGLEITGIAFILSYFISTVAVYAFLNRETGFNFSKENSSLLMFIVTTSIVLLLIHYFNIQNIFITILEVLIALSYIIFGYYKIKDKIQTENI